jgi:hypothetical protein
MGSSDSYQLIVRRGPQPNQAFDLKQDVITLGRDITNDIVINDPEASRHHLRFTRGASGYNIEDLGSTNGTFIAGQRLSGVRPLNPGDMIGLGETVTLGYELVRSTPTGGSADETISGPQEPAQQQPAPAQQPPAPVQQQPPAQQFYSPPPVEQQPDYDQQRPAEQPPQPGYAPQQQQPAPPPAQQDYDQSDYGYDAPQAPPSYSYEDPYAVREDEPSGAMRWLLIGCLILMVFCCCSTVMGFVIIDALDLWEKVPILKELVPLFRDIAEALGQI